MAFAPLETYQFPQGDGSILGQFCEADTGNLFEFSENRTGQLQQEFPHLVWVTEPRPGIDGGFRYARVLKTRVHIAVDEDENGPVVETWHFRGGRRIYCTEQGD